MLPRYATPSLYDELLKERAEERRTHWVSMFKHLYTMVEGYRHVPIERAGYLAYYMGWMDAIIDAAGLRWWDYNWRLDPPQKIIDALTKLDDQWSKLPEVVS